MAQETLMLRIHLFLRKSAFFSWMVVCSVFLLFLILVWNIF